MKKWFAMLLCLVVLTGMLTGCTGSTSSAKKAEPAIDEVTEDMKLAAVTYSQTAVKDYLPNASFPWSMDNYTVNRYDQQYKIEGAASGNKYWCTIRWDYKKDEYFDVIYLKIADQVCINNQ